MPQDYCNLVVEYINERYRRFLRTRFTEKDVYNYCLNNTEYLDDNDEVEIERLVKNILTTLASAGFLSLNGITYRSKNRIPNDVFVCF